MNWSLFVRAALAIIEAMPQLASDVEALYNKVRETHPASLQHEAVMSTALQIAKTQAGGA